MSGTRTRRGSATYRWSVPANDQCRAYDIDGDGIPEIALAYEFANVARTVLAFSSILRFEGRELGLRRRSTASRLRTGSAGPICSARQEGAGERGPDCAATAEPPGYEGRHASVLLRPEGLETAGIPTENRGVVHGILITDWNGDKREDVLTASFTGIDAHEWSGNGSAKQSSKGAPDPWPKGGSSDIAVGTWVRTLSRRDRAVARQHRRGLYGQTPRSDRHGSRGWTHDRRRRLGWRWQGRDHRRVPGGSSRVCTSTSRTARNGISGRWTKAAWPPRLARLSDLNGDSASTWYASARRRRTCDGTRTCPARKLRIVITQRYGCGSHARGGFCADGMSAIAGAAIAYRDFEVIVVDNSGSGRARSFSEPRSCPHESSRTLRTSGLAPP